MPRALDTALLDGAAEHYARQWLSPDVKGPAGNFRGGPSLVLRDLHNMTFKDAHEYLIEAIRDNLGSKARAKFDAAWAKVQEPRDHKVFEDLLAKKLAVDLNGDHIEGQIGTTEIGSRFMGFHEVEVEHPDSIRYRKAARRLGIDPGPRRTYHKRVRHYWPIYAGEGEERAIGSGVADPLPEGTPPLPVGALNTRISNECAILACDAVVDNLDEGTGAATVKGRTGAQPADPDTTASGTVLFSLTCSATAFGAAADATGKATATAASITDDTSADASGTVGYVRASATNDGATPIDDHIDGEAGTSGADWNFNTVTIVAGATVSATSWTVSMPES